MKKILIKQTELELLLNDETKATMMFEIIDDSIQENIPEDAKEIELLLFAQVTATLYLEDSFYILKQACDCNVGICNTTGECICCGEHIDISPFNKKSILNGKIVNVQVKRVKDIIREEVLKLGVQTCSYQDPFLGDMTHYEIGDYSNENSYFASELTNTRILEKLFNRICKERGIHKTFKDNPYVFLYEFERVKLNEE